jgi:hypothetical protein
VTRLTVCCDPGRRKDGLGDAGLCPWPVTLGMVSPSGWMTTSASADPLRAMRRGLETAYGAASEALPKETGSQRLGCTYGDQRQSSTLPMAVG